MTCAAAFVAFSPLTTAVSHAASAPADLGSTAGLWIHGTGADTYDSMVVALVNRNPTQLQAAIAETQILLAKATAGQNPNLPGAVPLGPADATVELQQTLTDLSTPQTNDTGPGLVYTATATANQASETASDAEADAGGTADQPADSASGSVSGVQDQVNATQSQATYDPSGYAQEQALEAIDAAQDAAGLYDPRSQSTPTRTRAPTPPEYPRGAGPSPTTWRGRRRISSRRTTANKVASLRT